VVALQFPPQGLQVFHTCLDLGELRGDQLLEARAQVLAATGVGIAGDLPDARQSEANSFGAADESEALDVFL
jgi:hypothetical protein